MPLVTSETTLTDFGDLAFCSAYQQGRDLIPATAKFTNLGELLAIADFRLHLTRRAKVVAYLKHHPQVLQVPIQRPIFVFGLGRSGTSFLHRLLSLDPKVRSPKLWELMRPAPPAGLLDPLQLAEDRKKRRDNVQAEVIEQVFFWLGVGEMERFHELGTDLPEECFLAMADELPCHWPHIICLVVL